MKRRLSVAMALLLAVVLFTLQNTETVSLRFLFWDFSLSRALMFFLILAVGLLAGFTVGSMQRNKPDNDQNIR